MQCACHLNTNGSIDPCGAHSDWAEQAMKARKTIWTDAELHNALDIVLAQWIAEVPKALPSRTSILELIHWHWFVKMKLTAPNPSIRKVLGEGYTSANTWPPSLVGDASQAVTQNPNTQKPIPMLLWCPSCGERHIDEGEFVTKPHHTHACQVCGMVWKPCVVPTVGVQFLPGYKNEGV